MLLAVRAPDAAWTPTNQQAWEPDTTLLFDPANDVTLGLAPAFGGFLTHGSGLSVVAGKFLEGYEATDGASWAWLPADGLLNPDEWTIEMWGKATADWTTIPNATFFALGTGSNFIAFKNAGTAKLQCQVSHLQNPASPSAYTVSATQASAYSSGTYPAAAEISLAATLKGGTLTLFANGSQVAQATGVVTPAYWGSTARGDGLWLPASTSGSSQSGFTLSDMRTSRVARIPGSRSIVAFERSVVTVSSAPTGTTVQPLTGGLKALPSAAADAQQTSLGVMKSFRCGQWLQDTPILAGATPDATHPSVGHSGSNCYDWQVVDRTLRYYDSLGCDAYVNISGVPNILGGSQLPYSSTTMTTSASPQQPDIAGQITFTTAPAHASQTRFFGYGGNVYQFTGAAGNSLTGVTLISGTAGLSIPGGSSVDYGDLHFGYCFTKQTFAAGPPSSPTVAAGITSLATMIGDLAYHIYNEMSPALSHPPVWWTPWNEPDGGVNWESGANAVTDYQSLYQQMATALKAVNSSAKMAGPEISSWSTAKTTWVQSLISFCGTNSVPLDGISWHFYSGDLSEPYQIRLQVDAWCQTAGLSTGKPLINGEWSWQIANIANAPWLQSGATPSDYLRNDWAAAYVAAGLIQLQAQGAVRAILNDPASTSFPATMDVLFDVATATPQSNWNVFRLWSMLGPTLVGCSGQQSVACDPGIFALASKDVSGKYYVLLANLHYHKVKHDGTAKNAPVLIKGLPVADGTPVTAYVVDDQHSNAYDAGTANASLQTTSTNLNAQGVNKVSGGQVGIVLRPRAAALLVIG